jgi:hypothetical protein
MSQSITISSINYDGELANIIFTSFSSSTSINIGVVTLPFEFDPSIINPSLTVYGTYSITLENGDCPNLLQVPPPSPSASPSNTPTRTPTPTPTPTPTVTPSPNPCNVTQTPSNSPSVSVTRTPTRTPTSTPTATCPGPSPSPSTSSKPEAAKIYWGKFSGTSVTSANTTSFSTGYTTNPTNGYRTLPSGTAYGYILIPTGLTQPSEFRESTAGCLGNIIPFNNIGTIIIIDANGFSITYNVYRTFFPFANSVSVWLCP